MNCATAKDLITKLQVSQEIDDMSPEQICGLAGRELQISLDNCNSHANPRFAYIYSNLKGVYFALLCDSCNKRCRKSCIQQHKVSGNKKIFILCNRCAGVKYKRKTKAEKLRDNLIKHPEKSIDFARNAQESFIYGDWETKMLIINSLGSKFVIKDRKLYIDLLEPFFSLKTNYEAIHADIPKVEIEKSLDSTANKSDFTLKFYNGGEGGNMHFVQPFTLFVRKNTEPAR